MIATLGEKGLDLLFRNAVLLCLTIMFGGAHAQSDVGNKIVPSASVAVTYDGNTGLFTYTYTLSSATRSQQEIDSFHVLLRGTTAVNVTAPRGWVGLVRYKEGGIVAWCACAEEGIVVPPGYVDNGQAVPSIYQIKAGQSLSGFAFQSPDPPAAAGTYLAGGFVQMPIEGVDFPPGMSPDLPTYPNGLFEGQVDAPLRVERTNRSCVTADSH